QRFLALRIGGPGQVATSVEEGRQSQVTLGCTIPALSRQFLIRLDMGKFLVEGRLVETYILPVEAELAELIDQGSCLCGNCLAIRSCFLHFGLQAFDLGRYTSIAAHTPGLQSMRQSSQVPRAIGERARTPADILSLPPSLVGLGLQVVMA